MLRYQLRSPDNSCPPRLTTLTHKSMQNVFSLILSRLLTLLVICGMIGCAATTNRQESQPAFPAPEPADTACSFFYYSWAHTAEMESHLLEAENAYKKALVCDPQSQFLKRQLVHLYIAMGKKEKAAAMVGALARNPDISSRSRLELAGIYENLGKTESAIALLQDGLKKDPTDSQSLLTLGYLYFRHKEITKARQALEHYIALEPDSYSGAIMLAKLYRAIGEDERAAAMYDKVLNLNWSTVQAIDAASFYESMHDTNRAIEIYEKLLENDESSEGLRHKLVSLYLGKGDYDKALDQLRIIRQDTIHPDKVDLAIGRVLMEQKKYKEAIDHFARMVLAYPDLEISRLLLAISYHETGDDDAARKVLSQVPPDSSEFTDAVLMSSRLYQDAGDLKNAAAVLEKTLKDKKRQQEVFYYVLADIYLKMGKEKKGEELFAKGVTVFPESVRFLFEFGLYMEKSGRPKDAMKFMEQVLQKDSNDPLALNYIGYTWAEQGIKLDKALDYISRAVHARPDDGYIRDSLGWVYYKMGKYDQAVDELKQAASLQSDDPTIHEHLGDAYMKLGKKEKAAQAYQQAISQFKDAKKRAKARKKLEEAQK